jgi:dTDP-4-dehydrorhamnose reductase
MILSIIQMHKTKFYRIAVTGSRGQLGQELFRVASGFPEYHFSFLTHSEFPVEDEGRMRSWLDLHPVDILINCAAYTAVDKAESETDKAFEINAKAPGVLAAILAEKNSRLIHISTDYVFDGNSASALSETASTVPVNQYGVSKLEGELRIARNNPDSLIIRTSWLYSSFGNNFVKTMMRLMESRGSIQVVNDQVGSPTYAGDLAKAIMEVISSGFSHPGIYHYSNEGETSWYEFAAEIKRLTGSACDIVPISSSVYPTAARRPAYSLMDKSKIKRDYNLAIPDWKASLAVCIEIIKKQGV